MVKLAKAKPGELNYSTGNDGTAGHLATELFKSVAGVNMVRVPYKAPSQQSIALMTGEVQLSISGAAAALSYVKSGKVKALGITTARPSALYPDMPTVASTVPGYEFVSITAVWAPAKTPDAIIKRLNQEFVRALNPADVKAKLLSAGQEIVGNSPEEFAAWVKGDVARVARAIKEANITPQ